MDHPSGYAHLAYFGNVKSSTPSKWLTVGNWEIDKILGIDNEMDLVYFTSTEIDSTQRHVYKVSFDGSKKTKMSPPAGISRSWVVPNLSHDKGSPVGDVGYYDASFSPNCHYYVLAYRGPDVPWKTIYSPYDPLLSKPLEDAKYIAEGFKENAFPIHNYTTIPNEIGDGKGSINY